MGQPSSPPCMMYSSLSKRATFFLLLCSILCFSKPSRAQNPDSLRGVLNERRQNDTTKVRMYAITARAYRYTQPDSLAALADRGITLAEKLHFDRGKADCMTARIIACIILGEYDLGVRLCNDVISICAKTNDSEAMALPYFYRATIAYSQSEYEKAIENYLKTVQLERNATDITRLSTALDNIGISYSTLGNYSESLKYYLEALKVREKAQDKEGISVTMGNIARVYASLGSHTKAVDYVNKCFAAQAGAAPASLMLNYENAGNVYLSVNDTAKALVAFETAIIMADSSGRADETNRILVNTAEVLITAKNYDKAYELYQRCLANKDVPNTMAVDAMIRRGLGRIYVHRKQYREGIRELEQSIALFKETGMKDHLSETLRELGNAYGEVHDYANGYKTMLLFNTYRDSVLNEETDAKVKELQYEYDLQKKQTEIELLAKDKKIVQGEAEKQRAVSMGLVSGLALLVIIIVIMYKARQREKAAKDVIAQQAASLRELNHYKDKIFSVLSHDLRGPIGAVHTTMSLLDANVITPEEFSDLKPLLHQQLSAVTLLLDNLLKWSMNHLTEGKSLKKEQLDVHKLVAQSINLMQSNIDKKNIRITNNVNHGITATADVSNIDIIIRNIISNAIKFTKPGGNITIDAQTSANNKVALSITDDGVGMTTAQLKKLFTPSPDNSSSGTLGERGIGLGMLMSYEFAKANNGDITVTSEQGKGSTFTLVLPA